MANETSNFNRQGREISESMRLAEFKKFLAAQPKPRPGYRTSTYRGYEIDGRGGRWFVTGDPRVFTSQAKARQAVDIRLELQALKG